MCSDRLGSRNARCSPPLRIHSDCDQSKQRLRLICRHNPPFFFICINTDPETTTSADACEWTCSHMCKQRRRADGYCCTAADSNRADYLSLKLGFLFSEEAQQQHDECTWWSILEIHLCYTTWVEFKLISRVSFKPPKVTGFYYLLYVFIVIVLSFVSKTTAFF